MPGFHTASSAGGVRRRGRGEGNTRVETRRVSLSDLTQPSDGKLWPARGRENGCRAPPGRELRWRDMVGTNHRDDAHRRKLSRCLFLLVPEPEGGLGYVESRGSIFSLFVTFGVELCDYFSSNLLRSFGII